MPDVIGPTPLPSQPWHVIIEGQDQGPYSLDEMASLAREGRLNPQTLVWKDGLEQWQAAHSLPELAVCFAPPAPPPDPPPAPAESSQPQSPLATQPPRRSSGLPVWVIVLLCLAGFAPVIAFLAFRAVPLFLEVQLHSRISVVKGDMRSTRIAVESYYVDNQRYPKSTLRTTEKVFGEYSQADQPGFMKSGKNEPVTLTTPVAYHHFYEDPFAPTKGATFSYWTPPSIDQLEASSRIAFPHPSPTAKSGYIIWSAGPDKTYDLSIDNIGKVYDPSSRTPSPSLIILTYDPTNGTLSGGDIWCAAE